MTDPAPQEEVDNPAEPTPTPQNDPTPTPSDPTPAEPTPTPPAPGTTVNRAKHEREVAKLEGEKDKLEKELEGYKALEARFDKWEEAQKQAATDEALKAAGCHDVVAATARLNEFDGDIDKLKEAAPYLFTSTNGTKSTGGNQTGAPAPEDERDKNMRKIMGLDTE